jgi:hypothetical protein
LKLIKILLLTLTSGLFFGCNSKSPNEPIEIHNYLPLKIGNYWIYRTYDLDNYSNPIASTGVIDSVAITATDSILGQKCWLFLTFQKGKIIDSSYYVNQNNYIFRLYFQKDSVYPGFIGRWYKVFDPDSKTWHVDDYYQYPYLYYFENDTVNATYKIQINAYFNDLGNQQINDSTWNCLQENIVFDNLIEFKYNWDKDTTTIKRHTLKNTRYYFVNNIGIALLSNDTYTIDNYSENPEVSKYPRKNTFIFGKRSYLLRYHLK